jgi:hypothetical protein
MSRSRTCLISKSHPAAVCSICVVYPGDCGTLRRITSYSFLRLFDAKDDGNRGCRSGSRQRPSGVGSIISKCARGKNVVLVEHFYRQSAPYPSLLVKDGVHA